MMKILALFGFTFAVAVLPVTTSAQEPKKSEEEFVAESPTLGDAIPDVTVYDSHGKEVKTSSLRGHYTVLTFGCLT
jgi:cytochrome oxidase Cu insertion factor (SCO1/SenC/PrrC family)